MEYTNELKGSLAQTAVCCALRHAGYPVAQTGIEMLVPVLPLLSASAVSSLELGPELRYLPDLCVLPHGSTAQQVEVKYRRRIDRESLQLLMDKLVQQQEHYPEAYTVVVRSVSPRGDAARADDLLRVLPPRKLELLAAADLFFHSAAGEGASEDVRLEPLWQSLRPMTSVFDGLRGAQRDVLEKLVPLIRVLGDL